MTDTPRAFDRLTLLLLAAVSAAVVLAHLPGRHATAWHWFHDAARLLVGDPAFEGPGGLSLYVDHPEFQFGPVSAAVVVPFSLFGRALGSWLAIVACSALGLVAVAAIASVARRVRPDALAAARPPALVVGATLFVVIWGTVAVRTAHIDDAVALTTTAVAVLALVDRRPGAATALLALAAAVKPWAVMFVPLLLVVPGPRRLVRPAAAAALAVATWVPFVLAAPATLDVRSHDIANEASSALRALGVAAATTPDWVRPAQLLGGAAVVALLVIVGRWPAALMAAVAVRLLLDPAANRYYTAGLVLAVLVFEWVEFPRRIPWLAVGATVALEVSQADGLPATAGGWIRIAVLTAVLATAALWRPNPDRGTLPPAAEQEPEGAVAPPPATLGRSA